MTDDIEERPVACSVQLHEATSRIADLEIAVEQMDALIAEWQARSARLASTAQGLSQASGIPLPDDIKKDITQSIGGGE